MRERHGVRDREEQEETISIWSPMALIPNMIGVQRELDLRASIGDPTPFLQRTGQTMEGDKNSKRPIQ